MISIPHFHFHKIIIQLIALVMIKKNNQTYLVTRRAFKAQESSKTKSDQRAQCTKRRETLVIFVIFIMEK